MKISMNLLFIRLIISSCTTDGTVNNIKSEDIQGEWRVTAFEKSDGSITPIPENDTIFVIFGTDGIISGKSHGECGNHFSSNYSLQEDAKIKINTIGSTEAVCPDSRYWDVIKALENARKCELNTYLILYYSESANKLKLQRSK